MPQTETGVHQCAQGLGAGTWGLESRPGEGLLLAVRRWPEGTGVRGSTTRTSCGGSLDCYRSKAPLLSDMQRAVPTAASLLTHWPLPLQALRRAPARVGSHGPAVSSSIILPQAWVTHLPRSLPDVFAFSNRYASTLLPGWPTHPHHHLGFFLPDGLVFSSNLWIQLWWEEHRQR